MNDKYKGGYAKVKEKEEVEEEDNDDDDDDDEVEELRGWPYECVASVLCSKKTLTVLG
jgi:hypothetical protein